MYPQLKTGYSRSYVSHFGLVAIFVLSKFWVHPGGGGAFLFFAT